MEWGVLLSSLDNRCRQIILLFRTARKRKNRIFAAPNSHCSHESKKKLPQWLLEQSKS